MATRGDRMLDELADYNQIDYLHLPYRIQQKGLSSG